MKKSVIYFSVLIFLTSCNNDFQLHEGDLLFQQSNCGPFCDAINQVTEGIHGIDFNHVGILQKDQQGEWVVLEAVTKGVVITPVNEFLERSKDDQGRPKVAVGRLKKDFQTIIPEAIKKGEGYPGKHYDQVFDLNNDEYYCSELVYFTYVDDEGKPLFELNPMTFKEPDTGEIFGIWKDYYEKLGQEIPEGKPGLNPGGISRSDMLDIYFPFSGFNGKIKAAD